MLPSHGDDIVIVTYPVWLMAIAVFLLYLLIEPLTEHTAHRAFLVNPPNRFPNQIRHRQNR